MPSTQPKTSARHQEESLIEETTRLTIQRKFQTAITNVYLSMLWDTVSSSDTTLLNKALEYSSTIMKTQEGGKLLWHAINKGDVKVASMLVRAGANLEIINPWCPHENRSFLHSLIIRIHAEDYEELAMLILEFGADVDARDANGKSVLYYAVKYQSIVLVKELVRRNATIPTVYAHEDDERETCVLRLAAAKSNCEELLEILIYSCEDEDMRNERAARVAEFYIDCGTDFKLKRLLERGLPVNHGDGSGWTLLHYAAASGCVEKVKLLVDCGANVNQQTYGGITPLHLAAFLPKSMISLALIEKGADIHTANSSGSYPIHVACHNQSRETIQLLVQLGADINVLDGKGRTPLSLMKRRNLTNGETFFIEHLACLVSKGKSVCEKDMECIRENSEVEKIFQDCLDELEKMKREIVINKISYFGVLTGNPVEISLLMRNKEFRENYKSNVEKMDDRFPIYKNRVKDMIEIAMEKQELLRAAEEYLSDIFQTTLPYLVIDKIAFYWWLKELKNVETKYYLRLHRKINMEIEAADSAYIRSLFVTK